MMTGSDFRAPALHPHTRSARLLCFAVLYSPGMPKAKHAHNEKLRKQARLQKIAKKVKKRAVQGSAPAAEF
jgi:hypothetical protein